MLKKIVILIFIFFAICKSNCNSQIWESLNGKKTSNKLYDVQFVDSLNGWAVGDNSSIIHTSDGGLNWEIQYSRTATHFYSVFFLDKNNGWAGGGGQLIHTSNGGKNWEFQSNIINSEVNSICFINDKIGWASGFYYSDLKNNVIYGLLLSTIDGGKNWKFDTLTLSAGLRTIHFEDSLLGWTIGNSKSPGTKTGVFKTKDGGKNWFEYPLTSSETAMSLHFINKDIGWYVSTDLTSTKSSLYKTTDGGESWLKQISLNYVFWNVDFINEQNGYISGSDEQGFV